MPSCWDCIPAQVPGAAQPGTNGPLLRSSLVLLVTAWENYIEQVLTEAVEHVTPLVGSDPSLLSPYLRAAVAKKATTSVWAVVGDGWLSAARKRLKHEIGTFNNAASKQVDDLVEQVLGIENLPLAPGIAVNCRRFEVTSSSRLPQQHAPTPDAMMEEMPATSASRQLWDASELVVAIECCDFPGDADLIEQAVIVVREAGG